MNKNSSIRKRLAAVLRVGLLAFSLALLLPAPVAFADSLRDVAERVARQHDAKLVSAREVERNGRKIYVIRILTRDGVVKTIRVPARERALLGRAVGAVSDRDRTPGGVANRSSLPQQANKAVGAVFDRDLASRVSILVMPGPDRASSVRSVGPGPTHHLTGLPVKPAMTQQPPASATRT